MRLTFSFPRLGAALGAALVFSSLPAGCGKSESTESGEAPSAAAPTGDEQAAAPVDESPPVVTKKKGFDGLFTTDKAGPFGPLKVLRLGSTKEEVEKALPEMFAKNYSHLASETHEDASFDVVFGAGTLTAVTVKFTAPGALEAIKAAWGAPVEGEQHKKPVIRWFNPEEGFTASYVSGYGEKSELEITRYIPAAQLIGTAKGLPFAFESAQALLGAKAETLASAYPDTFVGSGDSEDEAEEGQGKATGYLSLLPTEWARHFTRVNLRWNNDGTVRGYNFNVPYQPVPSMRDDIHALLKEKFGEPREEAKRRKTLYIYSEDPKVTAQDNDIRGMVEIKVETPKKR